MTHENEHATLEDEDKAIDQIARFCVFVARDLEYQERETGTPVLPQTLIKKSKKYDIRNSKSIL